MKKLFLLLSILTFSSFSVNAQSTTITPGTALPQMTSSQRTSLSNPVNGMLVFDTNTSSYWFYQQSSWVELPKGGSTSNYWELNGLEGNELKNTNSGGFWSANPTGLTSSSDESSNPPQSPVNGNGTRLMWIPNRSAFRVGTITNGFKSWDADSIGLFSFASGINTKAKGKYSTAMGVETIAIGNSSIAMGNGTRALGKSTTALGYNSTASDEFSTALGYGSKARNRYSTAMGYLTDASGLSSTAMGYASKASGISSTAMGESTQASGDYSTAMGESTKASGDYSAAIGFFCESAGAYSIAMGENTKAYSSFSMATGLKTHAIGLYSTAMGKETIAKAPGSTTIGTFNDTTDSPFPDAEYQSDRLFQIGNGSPSVRSNAMTVLRNGYIGTKDVIDPQANLHLKYTGSANWDAHLRLEATGGEHANIVYDNDGLKFRAWGATDKFYFRNSTNTTTARIYDTGNMTIAGTLTQNSDKRLKKNIVGLHNSSNKLIQLNGYNYNWKAADRDQSLQTGLIAQEVQALFPELVSEDEGGYLSVNYTGLIPHLIEALKELKQENIDLKAESNNRMASMEEKLDLLLSQNVSEGAKK